MVIPLMDISDGDAPKRSCGLIRRNPDSPDPEGLYGRLLNEDAEEGNRIRVYGNPTEDRRRNFFTGFGVFVGIISLGIVAYLSALAGEYKGRFEATSKQILTSVEKDKLCPDRPFTTVPTSDSLPKRFYRLVDSQIYEEDKVCIYEQRIIND